MSFIQHLISLFVLLYDLQMPQYHICILACLLHHYIILQLQCLEFLLGFNVLLAASVEVYAKLHTPNPLPVNNLSFMH